MAQKLYEENNIQEIANAIREKNGSIETYKPSEMADAIRSIVVGSTPETVEQATPTIVLDSRTGVITASATQTAGYVNAGTKSATRQLNTIGGYTITPRTYEQTAVPSNNYTLGAVKVAGDTNLVSANIRNGVSIFGVPGNYVGGSNSNTYKISSASFGQIGTNIISMLPNVTNVQRICGINILAAGFYNGDFMMASINADNLSLEQGNFQYVNLSVYDGNFGIMQVMVSSDITAGSATIEIDLTNYTNGPRKLRDFIFDNIQYCRVITI